MVIRLSARLISVVLLAALSAIALTLVLRATPEGLGLIDDSIAYVAGARSMLAGNGYREAWLASNGPVTHFPPGYPAVLTFLGWFGLEPVRGARFLNAVLFALNTALSGILGWRMTRSLPAGLILSALFVLNPSLLRLHASVLSEPLFIFLSLSAFWLFDLYHERDDHWLWLLACGTAVGMAYLTRYAGLALAATMAVTLAVMHPNWHKRLVSLGIFAGSLLPWIGGWALRNAAVGGTATNRALVWHPITGPDLHMALRSVSAFVMPVEVWRQTLFQIPGFFVTLVVMILGAILVYVLLKLTQRLASSKRTAGEVLALLSAIYVFGYLASILAAMSFFDASTKLKLRILAPIYVNVLVLAVALGAWAWSRRRELVIGVTVGLLALSTYGQVESVRELAASGQGYASFRWYDSQAMEFLRQLPAEIMIYTNEPGAVYLYTGKPAYVLPDRVDPATAAQRPGFLQGVQQLQSDVRLGMAVLALFSGGDTPPEDAAALANGLELVHKSAEAEIYGAAP